MLSSSFRRSLAVLTAACCSALGSRSNAETTATATPPPSLEERLDRLEQELSTLRQENQQLRQQLGVLSSSSASVIKPQGHETLFSIGGFLHTQGEFGDPGDSRFGSGHDRIYVRRARLSMAGRYTNHLDFKFDVEMAGNLSDTSGYRGQMLDGLVNWTQFSFANVRVGQFKAPFGFELLGSDLNLYTIERAMVSDRLPINRQIGAQLSGSFAGGRLAYATGVFNGAGANTNANDNNAFAWVGRVTAVPWQGEFAGQPARWVTEASVFTTNDYRLSGQPAEFGFDSTPGDHSLDNVFTGHRAAMDFNSQFRVGPLDLWAEYIRSRFEPTSAIPASSFDAAGWYVQAAYTFIPDKFQSVLKFDTYDPNLHIGGNATDIWTVGANYFFSPDVKLMTDLLLFDTPGQPRYSHKLLMRLQTIF